MTFLCLYEIANFIVLHPLKQVSLNVSSKESILCFQIMLHSSYFIYSYCKVK
jgi:hypothetical protein